MMKMEGLKMMEPKTMSDSIGSKRSKASNDDTCGDCWGAGWAIQFVKPCGSCNGTGKKPKPE